MCLVIVCWSGCAERRPDLAPKLGVEAPACRRAELPQKLDPRSVTWQLVVPPHGELKADALIDTCDSIVSLAHDVASFGPSQWLRTSNGEAWSAVEIEGAGAATFLDLERAAGKWVAVGRSGKGDGVIAVSDALDREWLEVYSISGSPIEHVAFGAGTFVAHTRAGVIVSDDGLTWSPAATPGNAQYFDVAFGNGRFVLAGVGATLTSSDGRSWEPIRCPKGCEPPVLEDGSPAPEKVALQQVSFVGDKFYAFGASGSYESNDGVSFLGGTRSSPDAAIGGLLVSMASDPEAHFSAGRRIPDPPRVFISQDGGSSYFSLPLSVSDDGVDCASVPCVVVPQGILVLQPKQPTADPSSSLCDGTRDIRLMYSSGPGFVGPSYMFQAPYGSQFFAIDGECHYWAQHAAGGSIVAGVLSPEQAAQLSADLAWRELPDWGNYHPVLQCPDAGGVTLGTARVALSCGPQLGRNCGCGAEAPTGLTDAMTAAGRWATTLIQAGMPVAGAIAAVAQRTEVSPASSMPPRPWPLARSVASIPDLVAPPNSHSFERYARFEDAAELGELRALRAQPAASGLSVSDGAETYTLYLRDELPEDTAKAFREFMGAWRFE